MSGEHVELRSDGREEIHRDFPGASRLRQQILEARSAGDDARVETLQREYRSARVAAQPVRSERVTAVSSSSPVMHTPTTATNAAGFRGRALLSGILLGWGPVLAPSDRGSGQLSTVDIQAPALASWLREVDPADVPVYFNHDDRRDPLGRHVVLESRERGLVGTFALDDTPAAWLIVEQADERALWLSCQFKILRSHRGAELRDGSTVVVADQVEISEVSVTLTPADERCVVETVRGRRPTWLARVDAIERDEMLRRTFGLA